MIDGHLRLLGADGSSSLDLDFADFRHQENHGFREGSPPISFGSLCSDWSASRGEDSDPDLLAREEESSGEFSSGS